MPTGIAIHDARKQLFDAAERILLRDGPSTLTTRAVTAEAGCANGVLHRHFTDFDAFLTELVLDRIKQLEARSARLRDSAGTGEVVSTLAKALTAVFESVVVAILALVTFRDELRAQLRAVRPGGGVPLATEAVAMIAAYLTAEQDLGRIAPDADIDTLAPTLIGAAHLLFADPKSTPPEPETVRKMVATVVAGVVRAPFGGPDRSSRARR